MYIYVYITKKNFGLIHVYFLYTVFRAAYRAVISKVTCLLNYIEKNRDGEGMGEISVLVVYSWHFILR